MQPMTEKNQLQIELLGPPIVKYAGQVQTIKRYQTRAVLYYLASQEEPVSRESLCAKFWPNLSDRASRKKLREILSHLRGQFPDLEVITARYDQLSLNSERLEIDVRKFQNLIDRVHFNLYATPTGKLPESLYRELREGTALWRSPHFMQGFAPRSMPEFETWMLETARVLQNWEFQFLERLVDHTISSGNLSEALFWIWQATQIEPLKTDLHYLALTCLRDSGRMDEFAGYMEQLKKIYQIDHGMEIPELLTDFVARSLEGKEKFGTHFGESGEQRVDQPLPFIGRKELLQQLNLWSMRGGIIYLKGESGIGKSRLLQEFYNRVDFPIRSVFCDAQPTEQNLPFQPLIDGLRSAAKPEDWQSLSTAQAQVLTRLFPEIAEIRPDLQNDQTYFIENTYQAIFEAIYALLLVMAGQKHLVVFFDDIHWGDEASISLLVYLCSQGLFQKNNVLMLASRIDEKNKNLQQFIHAVERRSDFSTVQLDYLNDREVGELVYSVLGKMPPPEMVAKLMREIGGNPLFLHQTLKLIMDYSTNVDSLAVLTEFPIPREVQAVISERLESLSPDTRSVVNVCAVIGASFTPDLVEDVCKMEPERLVQVLEHLVDMHLLNEAKDTKPAGGYSFAHEKIRDSILKDLSPARSRMLNLQVVEALEKRHGKPLSLSTRYAQYYEAAGELKAALAEWILAGQYARQLFSRNDAYYAYQHAFDLIKQNNSLFDTKEIHELVTRWGNYAHDIQDKESSEFLYQNCLEWGKQRQDPFLIGTGQSGLARVMGMRNQIPSALKHMQLALKSLKFGGWQGELIEAYTRLGNLYHLSYNYHQAREAYEQALSMMNNEEGSRTEVEVRISAQALLSILYSETGWPAKALELANAGIESSQTVHRITSRIQAYTARSIALFYSGCFREAVETGQVVLEDAAAKGMAFWGTLLNSNLARSYISIGFLDKAWTHLDEAYHQSVISEMPYLSLQVGTIRAELYRSLHQFSKAEKEYLSSIRQKQFSFITLESLFKLGYIKLASGDHESGREMLDKAKREAEQMELGAVTLPARAAMLIADCTIKAKIDDPGEYQDLIRQAKERGFMPLPLWLEFVKFTFDYREGLTPEGLSRLPQLIKEIHDSGFIWLELDIHAYIASSKVVPAEYKTRSRQRISAICDFLYENALQEPVKEMVVDYVASLENSISPAAE